MLQPHWAKVKLWHEARNQSIMHQVWFLSNGLHADKNDLENVLRGFRLGGHNEEDSKQAAEAMVQLSGVGFYNQQGTIDWMSLVFFWKRERAIESNSTNFQ